MRTFCSPHPTGGLQVDAVPQFWLPGIPRPGMGLGLLPLLTGVDDESLKQ